MPYNIKLPLNFFLWWIIRAPIKIFKMGKVIVATENNAISFTANIRYLFVPMFGLTDFIGRFVSFLTRVMMIFIGMILMALSVVACLLAPLLWLAIPYFIYRFFGVGYILLFFLILYLVFILKNLNTPKIRVSEVTSDKEKILSFRPKTRYLINNNTGTDLIEVLFLHKDIIKLLQKTELEKDQLLEKIIKLPQPQKTDIINYSFQIAKENKSRYVETEHLFVSLIENTSNIQTVLSIFGSSPDMLKKTAFWIVEKRELLSKVYMWQEDYIPPLMGGIGKGMLGRVTPNLDSVSVDITKQVEIGNVEDIVGREEEIKKISEILDGEKNDILLVGESGIGKTSIIRGIAYKIMAGTEYKTLKNRRVVSLEIGSLVSENKGKGNVADKITNILKEIEISGDIILFIDEMQNIVTGMGEKGGNESTILSILENHISKSRIRIIGAVSMSNYRKYIEPNEAVSRLFQIIKINETSKEGTVDILKTLSNKYERQHGILITYPALISCIELSEKLIGNRVLPDKAIDVLERASTSVKNATRILNSEVISEEISKITDVPVTEIGQDEADKLLSIGEKMKGKVIGQNHAIDKIKIALQRSRTRMRDESKPIAAFLFVGMTGVGKTETAKTLAEHYFGEEKRMIRLDMSEYQQIDSINRIIGTPDGNSSGSLTEKVRNKPFSLLLIDEIEKAHPNIILTFLQMLDEGRLTDTSGVEADFTNTIIIATSNVGTKTIQDMYQQGKNYQEIQNATLIEVRNKFAPELLNRFTAIIVFNPLSIDNLKEITKLMLNRVKIMAKEKGIEIDFKPELIEELIKKGYSPEWGARPLARVIEDSVESYIALKLLKKEINPGDRIMLGNEVFDI